MPSTETIRQLSIRASTPGVAESTAALQRLSGAQGAVAASAGVMATSTDTASKRTLSAAASIERLAKAYDPLYAATTKAEAGQRRLDMAFAQGLAGTPAYIAATAGLARAQQQLATANDNGTKAAATAGAAHKAHGAGMGQSMMAAAELQHVMRALSDEIAAGQSPMRALQMEGGRLFEIIGSGGLGGALSGVVSKVAAFANPFTIGTAAVAGLGFAALTAARNIAEVRSEMDRAVSGVGAFAGLTGHGLEDLAHRQGSAAGLSHGAGESVAGSLAATGHLDADNIGRVMGLTRGYQGAYGGSSADAGKALGDIFKDPLKGLDTLNERFGFLDGATRSYVETLMRQGREQEAVRVAVDAASTALNTMAAPQGPLDKLSSWWSQRNAEVEHGIAGAAGLLPVDPMDAYRKVAASMGSRDWMGRRETDPGGLAENYAEDVRNRAMLGGAGPLMLSPAREIEIGRNTSSALDTAKVQAPELTSLRDLQADRDKLAATLNDSDAVRRLGDQAGVAFAALEKMNLGLATFATAADRMRQDSAFRVAAINAEDAAGKLAVDAQAAYARTLRDTHDATQAAAASETMRAEAIANATKRISDATDALDRQTDLIGLKPYQRLAAEAQNRLDDFKRDNTFGGFTTTPAAGVPAGAAAFGAAPGNIQAMVTAASARTGQDPNIIAAIGKVENGFRLTGGTTMLGSDGRPSSAYGFGQLTNGAARDVAAAVPGFDKHDPNTAVFGAAEYLKLLRDRNGGDLTAALRAYGGTADYPSKIARASGGAFAEAGHAQAGVAVAGTDLSDYTKSSAANLAKGQAELAGVPFTSARLEVDQLKASVAAQMEAFGKTGNELAAYNEKTKILNQLQSAGVPITDAMRSNAAALGQEYAAAGKQLDDFHKRQADLVRTMDDVHDAGRNLLDPLAQAALHGTSAMKALHQGLESVGSKLTGKLEDSLMDTVLGAKGTAGGGIFGGGLSSLFGAGQGGGMLANLGAGENYSSGGFTGFGGKYEPAGVVHRGEYVVQAAHVPQNINMLHALNTTGRWPGFADGGLVGGGAGGGGSAAGGGGDTHIHVQVNGATGNTELHQITHAAVSSALASYDKALPGRMADRQRRS